MQKHRYPARGKSVYYRRCYYNRSQLSRATVANHVTLDLPTGQTDVYDYDLAEIFDRLSITEQYRQYFQMWNSAYPEGDKAGSGFVDRYLSENKIELVKPLSQLWSIINM